MAKNMAEADEPVAMKQSKSSEDNILYDLTVQTEWPQETEAINRRDKGKKTTSLTGRLSTKASRSTWSLLRRIGVPLQAGTPYSLPGSLFNLVSSQLNWHLDVSCDGRLVAILLDQSIEIRSSHDDFQSAVAKWNVTRDAFPQWRCIQWGIHSDMVAYADSLGNVTIYDITGTPISQLATNNTNPVPGVPQDLSAAISGLIFKEPKEQDKWVTELLVINYRGSLKCFQFSSEGDQQLHHTFSFSAHCPGVVSAVVYHRKHAMLIVGGSALPTDQQSDSPTAQEMGITAWRILSDIPHYKLITDYEKDLQGHQKRSQLMRKLKLWTQYSTWYRAPDQDGVYKLVLSPDESMLAAVHYSGRFSLVHTPSLRVHHTWIQEDQPGFDTVNQTVAENPILRKQMKEYLTSFYLTDANWWSNQAVILTRGTGAVTLSSVNTLQNLLGNSPEWFEPTPVLSMAHSGGFLALECECKSLKRHHGDENEEDDAEDSDDEEERAFVAKSTQYIKHALYYVTDSERFQPPRKKPKIVNRTYRLICLKSTTPEELYARKIDCEEYGEALALAKAYKLDCDMVYQRQWRRKPATVATIQDYLTKIQKRSWVLHECAERVPENIDAMRELLQYGLRGTDLEALITIGEGNDHGRFILCDMASVYNESLEEIEEDEEEEGVESEKQRQRKEIQQQMLSKVNFTQLTLEQRELCRARRKMLQYLDRLATYEEILGGAYVAEERFDSKFFEKFRSQSIVELAVDYARAGDWRAVDIIISFHGKDTLPHRLAILGNFPEIQSPSEYQSLLPVVVDKDGDETVLSWEIQNWRDPDWAELPECSFAIDPSPPDLGGFLYEETEEYIQFRTNQANELTIEQVSAWYLYRAHEMEKLSQLIDQSLDLTKFAMDNKVSGLDKLYTDLLTMETLVYDCKVDDSFTFTHLEEMLDIDRLRLMMSQSSDDMYEKNMTRWMIPFLDRCDQQQPGSFLSLLHEYLISMAKQDLSRCLVIFRNSRADQPNRVISSDNELMSLALQCIYSCESTDQLSNAFDILECLPERGFGVVTTQSMDVHSRVDQLECHLSAAEIFISHEVPQIFSYIRDTQKDEDKAKMLLIKLTRRAGTKDPSLTEKEWSSLLSDMLLLQEKVYDCVSKETCYEIFVQSLLCSGRPQNIQLAVNFIEQTAGGSDQKKVSGKPVAVSYRLDYNKSLELILLASQEYFDAAANLSDSSMELARQCLTLITDSPKSVAEELDLIESLSLLDGFGVVCLPVQVRMCEDRLKMIKRALDAKPFTYKNSQRLLKLGWLLRVGGCNAIEREGQVMKLVAQAALKAKDYRVAHDACCRLMEIGFAEIWTECKDLAQAEEFQDIRAKSELLSFAVTHCSHDMIQPILKAISLLETQVLYERVHMHLADRDSQSPSENPLTPRGALQQTKEILSSTNKATKAVFSQVSNKKWWKKTLSSLRPNRRGEPVDQWDDGNLGMDKQGCHPFFDDVTSHSYLNKAEVDYERGYYVGSSSADNSLSESVLRTGKLEETLTEGEAPHNDQEVLLRLAQDCIAQDASLGLAYLLTLPQAEDAGSCFESVPGTNVTLELATYYYALQLHSQLKSDSKAGRKAVYSQPASKLVAAVLKHVDKLSTSAEKDPKAEMMAITERLKYYNELLKDYNQARALQALGRGVDVVRFTQDEEYKKETILGLAMSLDSEVYEIAVALSDRYDMSRWQVYMAHLEYLFESELLTSEIEERVNSLDLLPTLTTSETDFSTHMEKYVFPSISGTDHNRLLYYYSLLAQCKTDQQVSGVTPSTHVKLLRKIKSAAPGLDYRQLTDCSHRPLDVIRPVLTSENINTIAKLAPKIPDQHGGFLQSSVVYCAWALRLFYEGPQTGKKAPQTHKTGWSRLKQLLIRKHRRERAKQNEWIHRYESCGEYMHKLLPVDMVDFIDGITFVPAAIEQMEAQTRQEIVRRSLKLSKQHQGRKKKVEDTGPLAWTQVTDHLQQSVKHLELMTHTVILTLLQDELPRRQAYARQFEMSRSQAGPVGDLLVQMVVEGETMVMVSELLDLVPTQNWTVQTALKEAVSLVLATIRDGTKPEVLHGRDGISVLEDMVSEVSHHQQQGGDLVHQEDVMELLRVFCADASVPVKVRLQVLQLLEKCFNLSDEDLVLLILYRTEAVVSTMWPECQLNEDKVRSSDNRAHVFEDLLNDSATVNQFLSLSELLQVWPAMPHEEKITEYPWYRLIDRFVEVHQKTAAPEIVNIVRQLETSSQPLFEECVSSVYDRLHACNCEREGVKCLLLSEHTRLHNKAVDCLQQHKQADADEELLDLLLRRHLLSSLVSTEYYGRLVSYLMENQGAGTADTPYYLRIDTVANLLQEAGYDAEAGTLSAQQRGLHPSLLNFDVAMGMLGQWFNR